MAKLIRTLSLIDRVPPVWSSSATLTPFKRCICTVPMQHCQKDLDRPLLRNANIGRIASRQSRQISVSAVLCKKIREELYEKVRVYDPNNNFICDVELLVLEKFCHTYHTYTFTETETNPREGDGETVLKGYQLKKKLEGEVEQDRRKGAGDRKVKHVKEIKVKANQDPNSTEWKLEKVLQVLLDMGVVNITFIGKEPKSVIKAMTRGIQEYFKTAQIKQDGSLMQVSIPQLDTQAFIALFDHLYAKEAAKLKSVRELMDLERDIEKSRN